MEDEIAGAPEGASGIFLGLSHRGRGLRVAVAVVGALTALVVIYLVLHSA